MDNEIQVNGVTYVKKESVNSEGWAIIRSYASGVHFGLVSEKRDAPQGLEVTLLNSRRVHSWVGAASLSQNWHFKTFQISQYGKFD